MKEIINLFLDPIMQIFGYMNIEKILIPDNYKAPGFEKLRCKAEFYKRTGKFLDRVVINKYGQLLDGYTTIFLAKAAEQRYVKVDVIDMLKSEYINTFRKYKEKERKNFNGTK